jgi:hypothetical protein
MVHSTVEDAIASFPHHILHTLQGEPDYHTIRSIRKLLRTNARSIESHMGGGVLSVTLVLVCRSQPTQL